MRRYLDEPRHLLKTDYADGEISHYYYIYITCAIIYILIHTKRLYDFIYSWHQLSIYHASVVARQWSRSASPIDTHAITSIKRRFDRLSNTPLRFILPGGADTSPP